MKNVVTSSSMDHPFSRYADFTDLDALLKSLVEPVRKSLRVNTLKASVDYVRAWAHDHKWELENVPWCEEGFFIANTCRNKVCLVPTTNKNPLGSDLLHQLGHFYIQEASSMLPIELLDPQPNETVLDLCAAPGSKTTQIATKMKNTGVIVANDVQMKRLWTLKQNLKRCGAINTITVNRKGEWFGKQMTEQFDRVLCDAPCSAQGIVRSDPKALKYSPEKRVKKLANAQMSLLESAIHATKVGGRIVYSTCTLTPEENEEVVMKVLEKFSGKISIKNKEIIKNNILNSAKESSIIVQKKIKERFSNSLFSILNSSFFRLWPHTYNTDGFFCAVLTKIAPTRDILPSNTISLREKPLTANRERDLLSDLKKQFGVNFLHDGEDLLHLGDVVHLTTHQAALMNMPTPIQSIGLPFLKGIRDSAQTRPTHELITLRGNEAISGILELDDEQARDLLDGKDTQCSSELYGVTILRYKNLTIGISIAKEGFLKNWLPRQFVQQVA